MSWAEVLQLMVTYTEQDLASEKARLLSQPDRLSGSAILKREYPRLPYFPGDRLHKETGPIRGRLAANRENCELTHFYLTHVILINRGVSLLPSFTVFGAAVCEVTQARLAEWHERLLTDWAQTREELIGQLKACRRDDWAQKVASCERDQLVDLTGRLDLPKVEQSVARLKRLDAALCQMDLGLYGSVRLRGAARHRPA